MPQMSPMWWTTLFLTFIMVYMLYVIITYFFISCGKKNEMKKSIKINKMNWTW
uniref:ATP synthase F0 subunit 8 n=1 Tax=Creontiades dilutus TaxID=173679 RepID=A0A342KBM0_9HEMI|nr:ATP synthase F0 subunit 8 [Creontiades dilutus]AND82401.1 ATP synthase F0 subunit 8 [Creontiades dilutus]